MFISKIELKNFKRFTDLTVDLSGISTPPKLVLMIGANGSGKSSIFDAFEYSTTIVDEEQEYYYRKIADYDAQLFIYDTESKNPKFYGRSAHRHVPQLTRQTVSGLIELAQDSDRPRRYIEFDQRFENDIAMLMRKMFADFFGEKSQADAIKKRYIEPINLSLENIFGNDSTTSLKLYSLLPPIDGKPVEIFFSKGKTQEIHYDLLSSGEKEIVNILFNLLNRREYYQDTIYFIDELDVHLNTALQYNLIKEITENWIPDNCQLWTASHSLGFIQYAQESKEAVILDFDQLDFDQPHTILPQPKESLEIYEIAVPGEILPKLFKDRQIVLCENQNDEFYNLLALDNKLFIGVKDKRQVFVSAKGNETYLGLMDRDYLADSEIVKIREKYPNLYVLNYYNFENYLYHPDNLAQAIPGFNQEAYQAEIVRQKNEQRDGILMGLELARRSYAELNEENLRDKNAGDSIATALRSDELESFYPFFDMKSRFNHQPLAQLNLAKSRLVQTTWFKAAINKLLPRK